MLLIRLVLLEVFKYIQWVDQKDLNLVEIWF